MGGEFNVKMINMQETVGKGPPVGDTVYAQALDGGNQDVLSINQVYHDQVTQAIAPQAPIQTGSVSPVSQGFQSTYLLPVETESPSIPSWIKYSVFFGLGFLVFKYFRRK